MSVNYDALLGVGLLFGDARFVVLNEVMVG